MFELFTCQVFFCPFGLCISAKMSVVCLNRKNFAGYYLKIRITESNTDTCLQLF